MNGKDLRSVHFQLGTDIITEQPVVKADANAFVPAKGLNVSEPNIQISH
jgi:hypothetical protein